jgi:hypothetical protein
LGVAVNAEGIAVIVLAAVVAGISGWGVRLSGQVNDLRERVRWCEAELGNGKKP